LSLAGPVQVEREVDRGFGCLSLNTGGTRHVRGFSRWWLLWK
jgi:hypothetical protein